MASALLQPKSLQMDPIARIRHGVGLEAELAGDFTTAHVGFDGALSVLEDLGRPDDIHVAVQTAHILRDKGFSYAREALVLLARGHKADSFSLLDQAATTITSSRELTEPIVGRWNFRHRIEHQKVSGDVWAEHGATLSVLGRLCTVGQITGHKVTATTKDRPVPLLPVMSYYGSAHDSLRRGNNGYYRASNAMLAARHALLDGQSKEKDTWLRRATFGLAWTALRDPRNLQRATLTAGSRALHLRSTQAATRSVLTHP